MARPTKLTPEIEALILEALRAGNTRTAAAEYVGIPRETMSRWMGRNLAFRHAVIRAEAEAQVKAVGVLRDAYEAGDWRAAFAWLERRYPDDWGRRDKVEIVNSIRDMARQAGASPEEEAAAVAEAERMLAEVRQRAR